MVKIRNKKDTFIQHIMLDALINRVRKWHKQLRSTEEETKVLLFTEP